MRVLERMTRLIDGAKAVFLVSSESDFDNPPFMPTKANPPVRPGPKPASCPTGKLARCCQNIHDGPFSPTPAKALAVPRPLSRTVANLG
jgi:hypothetical protein